MDEETKRLEYIKARIWEKNRHLYRLLLFTLWGSIIMIIAANGLNYGDFYVNIRNLLSFELVYLAIWFFYAGFIFGRYDEKMTERDKDLLRKSKKC